MTRKMALKKLLAVMTGSVLIVGGAALANAAASDGPTDPADTGVVLSDPPVVSTIGDVVVGDDQGENEDVDEADVNDTNDDAVDDDQGENENADEADVNDTNDDAVDDDQGENEDDQGENEDVNDDEQDDVNDDAQEDGGSED
jgi:hypothetical protein